MFEWLASDIGSETVLMCSILMLYRRREARAANKTGPSGKFFLRPSESKQNDGRRETNSANTASVVARRASVSPRACRRRGLSARVQQSRTDAPAESARIATQTESAESGRATVIRTSSPTTWSTRSQIRRSDRRRFRPVATDAGEYRRGHGADDARRSADGQRPTGRVRT